MEISTENFPLYKRLLELNEPGIDYAKSTFEKAIAGSDDDEYLFVHGLQMLAFPPNQLPNATEADNLKTLQSCLDVYEDVGNRGHAGGAIMAAVFRINGFGCEKDKVAGKAWLDRSVELGFSLDSQFVKDMYLQVESSKLSLWDKFLEWLKHG